MRKGLSLIEMMVVVIIIAVLAVLALPNLRVPQERARVQAAEVTLKSIYQAQKRYKLNNESGVYYVPDARTADSDEAISRNLSLSIDDPHFNYTIEADGSGYVAKARRVSGPCEDKLLSIAWNDAAVRRQECKGWGD